MRYTEVPGEFRIEPVAGGGIDEIVTAFKVESGYALGFHCEDPLNPPADQPDISEMEEHPMLGLTITTQDGAESRFIFAGEAMAAFMTEVVSVIGINPEVINLDLKLPLAVIVTAHAVDNEMRRQLDEMEGGS